MAVLSLPAIVVSNHDPVSAFPICHGCPVRLAFKQTIRFAVAQGRNTSRCRSNNRYAARGVRERLDSEVGALMPVVGGAATAIVDRSGAGIEVYELLNEAVRAELAGNRQGKLRRVGQGRARPEENSRRQGVGSHPS